MTRRHLLAGPFLAVLASLFVALGVPASSARAEGDECATPAELTEGTVKLPRLAERLRLHQPVTIVAIGGASTIGQAAGSPDLAYPHRLEQNLTRDFPGTPITVVNKGVPRQSAQQMVGRFSTDVIAEDPILVIWEAGITDAVRGIEIDDRVGGTPGMDQIERAEEKA